MSALAPRVILITDPSYSLDHVARVVEKAAAALGEGALMVQLRDKDRMRPLVAQAAVRLRQVTRDAGALLCINAIRKNGGEMGDLAEDIGADGLHVRCLASDVGVARTIVKWVSVPVHTDAEARGPGSAFADAMLVSPIFPSPGKGLPRGVAALAHARQFRPRVYALGGVTPATAPMCARSGAHGVAVIRALLGAEDPAAVALELAKPFTLAHEDV